MKNGTYKVPFLFISLADEGSAQGGAPAFTGIQHRGGGLFFPNGGAVFHTGDAVPGFDADKLGQIGRASCRERV